MKKHIGPLLVLTTLVAVIVAANYTPGTFLTGWDNLHPEFNFALNIKRSLFGVWQEYQGLGLVGGMGHAADLPRQLMLWAASILLPAQLLRWFWTFFMLLAGPLGVYALVQSIQKQRTPWIAFTGAIFYLFNLVTVQVFTAPFDGFVAHYGILPWLLWSNWTFLHAPSRKRLLIVAAINVIGMTHAYIPTLFLVYMVLLGILCLGKALKRIFILVSITFCINAFWLLPFAYFTLTKSPVTVRAKINQMATQETYLQNKAFGDIGSVATLKNFWYDTADYNPDTSKLESVLGYWKNLEQHNWIVRVRYTLASFIFFGALVALSQKRTRVWGVLGIVAVSMVAVDTPPFVWMIDWLRINIPLFSQFFRSPFTKWGIALALFYAVWLGIGMSWLIERMHNKINKIVPILLVTIPLGLSIIGAIGLLQGHLISQKFKLAIPDEYFKLFNAFKTLPPGRIANFPQNTYWGWSYYRWGYSGSGFLWYGIENPIMDRAFDPWSGTNENYYWELSRSIYSKDAQGLAAVLNKYDARYILLDENLISPSHNRALYTDEIKAMVALLPEIKETARFGNLTLYERTKSSQSFVSLSSNLPTVSPAYGWTDNDVAYGELGDYITESSAFSRQLSDNNTITYPFRSLFTKRSIEEREFRIEEDNNTITILPSLTGKPSVDSIQNHQQQNNDKNKCIPYADSDIDINPIGVHSAYSSNFTAPIKESIPKVMLKVNTNMICEVSSANIVGSTTSDPIQPAAKLVKNPESTLYEELDKRRTTIVPTLPKTPIPVNVIIKTDAIVYDSTKSADLAAENVKPCGVLREGEARAETNRSLHFGRDDNASTFLRFMSRNQRGCLNFGIGDLPHREGYLVSVESRHITGRPMLFSLINQTAKHVELETYLESRVKSQKSKVDDWQTDYFVLPPLALDGLGYTVYLSNDAIGPASAKASAGERHETVNDIKSIKFYRIPYQELVSMRVPSSLSVPISSHQFPLALPVNHPNPAYYKVSFQSSAISGQPLNCLTTEDCGLTTLVLSQSFDNGWIAMAKTNIFPFFAVLKDHVLVNNWENGWELSAISDQSSDCLTTDDCRLMTIVVFFLPQLLEFVGLALLPVPFLMAARMKLAPPSFARTLLGEATP